jgi:hypothetical protein
VTRHRIFATSFASIYPHDVGKAEGKNRSKDEADQVSSWLTGYDAAGLEAAIAAEIDVETSFAQAPAINPRARLITGVICGYRVEEIEDPLMQKIRYLDKPVDELARGKKTGTDPQRTGGSTAMCAARIRQPTRPSCTQVREYRIRADNGLPSNVPARVPVKNVTPVVPATSTSTCSSTNSETTDEPDRWPARSSSLVYRAPSGPIATSRSSSSLSSAATSPAS